jgi:DNA-binding NtrC family response regulator
MGRVLVVDDDPLIRWSLGRALSREGYGVAALDSAEMGLADVEACCAEVEASCFGVAIVDVVLPGMDGLMLMTQMRSVCPQIKTIIITGQGSREVEQSALEHGACAYVEKPFSVNEIIGLVKTMLPSPEMTQGQGEVR